MRDGTLNAEDVRIVGIETEEEKAQNQVICRFISWSSQLLFMMLISSARACRRIQRVFLLTEYKYYTSAGRTRKESAGPA